MRRSLLLIAVIGPAVLCGGAAMVHCAGGETPIERARAAFERHNYRLALEELEPHLAASPDDVGARLLRGRCLLRLRQWDDGVAELEALLRSDERLAGRPELHEELGAAGLAQYKHRRLAVIHFGKAAELHVASGDRLKAAAALMRQAEGYTNFTGWDELPGFTDQVPEDWRAQRSLQVKYAAGALRQAIELAGDAELGAEATLALARCLSQDRHRNDAGPDESVTALAGLVERWPRSPRAPEALFLMGNLARNEERYVEAVGYFRRIVADYGTSSWSQRAARRMERIVKPSVELAAGKPVLPGARTRFHYRCRNVKSVAVRAYRVDLFEAVRKFGHVHKLDAWQPDGEPAGQWTLDLPDEGKHLWFQGTSADVGSGGISLADPGAYLIVAQQTGGEARASTLLLVSRLSCLTKGGQTSTLLFAADAVSGKPAAQAEILIQQARGRGQLDYVSAKTDDAGRYRQVTPKAGKKGRRAQQMVFVRDGEHYAVCGSESYWYWWGYGGPYRAYCFTERPVYRPDQVVHFKTVLRRYDLGVYSNSTGKAITAEVYDPRGEVTERFELRTGQEGTASGELRLPDGAPLGMYHLRLTVDGQQIDAGSGARFRVEEYRKPEYEVTVAAARTDYRIGEPVDVRIDARYYFGEPVAGAKVACTVHRAGHDMRFDPPTPWPWFIEDFGALLRAGAAGHASFWLSDRRRTYRRDLVGRFELTTDENGVALLRLDTEPLDSDPDTDLRYDIEAEVTDASRRVITGSGSVKVTHQPFYVNVRPQRSIYQPGDTVRLEIRAKSPNDAPVAFRGTCKVYRLNRTLVELGEEEGYNWPQERFTLGDKVLERPVTVGDDGSGAVEWITDQEGPFRVVVIAPADDDAEVTGKCDVWVARRGGRFQHYAYRDVELVFDRPTYLVGDTAKVLVNTRFDTCYVLLTVESDDLLDDRIIFVEGGTKLVELPITRKFSPNFRLAAAILRDNNVYQDQVAVLVPPTDQLLDVKLDTAGDTFGPREQIEVGVTITDSSGAPTIAEVALMMVDASIYYIQPELRQRIEKHFFGDKRPHLVRLNTSFDFHSGGHWYLAQNTFGGDDNGLQPAVAEAAAAPLDARMMKQGAPPGRGGGEDEADFATAEIRQDFPDTVLWTAHVMTDDTGQASVPVTLPDTLTTWRIHAVAIDRSTRVGQTSANVITRKNIIARLQAPRFLVEGDEPLLTVIAHNYSHQPQQVRVSLQASDGVEIGRGMVGGAPLDEKKAGEAIVTVPPGGELAVDFPARAQTPGPATLTATVAAKTDADALEITLPVITFGANRLVAHSGTIRQDDELSAATVSLTVPPDVAPESPLLEIHVNPSIAAVMIDALPYLLEYPYGCTEQTMSRFLPAVVTRRTLQTLGIDLASIQDRIDGRGGPVAPRRFRNNPVFNERLMDDMIAAGVERLADLQSTDGGWGWWGGGASNPYMTAYVVYGLTEAAAADVPFDRTMLERGVAFLLKRVVSTEHASRYAWAADDDNVRTWMLYALAKNDPALLQGDAIHAVIERIYRDRDNLTDYSRAMLMIVLHELGETERVDVLVENLYNTVYLDKEAGTAGWGTHKYRYWYNNGLETTAMVLRALLASRPDHPYVAQAVNWLVRNRRGARWFSTKDTAFAIYALADYLVASGELRADMTVGVTIDGQISRSFRITPDNALTFDARVLVAARNLTPGEHEVELTRSGRGTVYYGVYLDYFTRQDPIEPAGNEIHVQRSYHLLIPKEVTRSRKVYDHSAGKHLEETYQSLEYDRQPLVEGQAVASGDLIEVKLDVDARNNFEYLIFEDPKPAGCEPTELHSGSRWGGAFCTNVERRDRMTAFFATYLSQGEHCLTYRLRCETPGEFRVLPTKVEAMYAPLVRGNGRSHDMEITGPQ